MVGEGFGTTFVFFVCCYFSTLSLVFLVLVRIQCDFNKFYFALLQTKKKCKYFLYRKIEFL